MDEEEDEEEEEEEEEEEDDVGAFDKSPLSNVHTVHCAPLSLCFAGHSFHNCIWPAVAVGSFASMLYFFAIAFPILDARGRRLLPNQGRKLEKKREKKRRIKFVITQS